MKGQINLQYLIALIVFIAMVWYLTFQISSMIPTFRIESKKNILQLKAHRLTELLIKNPGEPVNWNYNSVKRIGLADSFYVLNQAKVETFRNLCKTNYGKVKDLFHISGNGVGNDFRLMFRGGINFKCGKRPPKTAPKTIASIQRLGIINSNPVTIELKLW